MRAAPAADKGEAAAAAASDDAPTQPFYAGSEPEVEKKPGILCGIVTPRCPYRAGLVVTSRTVSVCVEGDVIDVCALNGPTDRCKACEKEKEEKEQKEEK